MKSIFKKDVIKVVPEIQGENNEINFIQIIYKEDLSKDKHIESFITGFKISNNDSVILRKNSCSSKEPIFVDSKEDDDVYIAKIIIEAIKLTGALHGNFNPYIQGQGTMLFTTKEINGVTGIGIDINNNYIIQKINPEEPKFHNKFYYKKIAKKDFN